MENREILVANTKTQRREKVTTNATTLGELKAALDEKGIDYSGMTFTEGITKTRLLDDSSPLPKDVNYKGNVTNNLVILLTNTEKNISSGTDGTRKEAYEIIRENDLMEGIKEEYSLNYTNVSTEDLWDYISRNVEDYEDAYAEHCDECDDDGECDCTCPECAFDNALTDLIFAIGKVAKTQAERAKYVGYALDELAAVLKIETQDTINIGGTDLTEDEIDDMIASV